jgi:hypothetical protein
MFFQLILSYPFPDKFFPAVKGHSKSQASSSGIGEYVALRQKKISIANSHEPDSGQARLAWGNPN